MAPYEPLEDAASTTDSDRAFEHIIVLVFENQYRSHVMDNPYMRSLADQGVWLANSFGVTHPSQANYIAGIAGELCNVTSNEPVHRLAQRNLVDLCEAAGIGWKAYMESARTNQPPWSKRFRARDCFPYVTAHNAFAAFSSITKHEARWAKVDNEAGFFADVLNGTLPRISWFIPNVWSGGGMLSGAQKPSADPRAPQLVDQLAQWLERFFTTLKFPGEDSHLPEGTLVVVTFDESDHESDYDHASRETHDGLNQIYTVLLGDRLVPGVDEEGYNHYSLLATIQRNFGLDDLDKNDRGANVIRSVFGEALDWEISRLSADSLYVAAIVADKEDGQFRLFGASEAQAPTWIDGGQDGGSDGIELDPVTALAACSRTPEPCIVYRTESGNLGVLLSADDGLTQLPALPGLDEPGEIGPNIAIASLPDGGLMIAWTQSEGQLMTCRYRAGEWESVVDTGFASDGGHQLASLGKNLLLIFSNQDQLRCITQNLADFNVLTATHEQAETRAGNNTTRDVWSPCAFPVAEFASVPGPRTPGEPEPLGHSLPAVGPFFSAVLDGVVHLLFRGESTGPILRTTFSIAGLLTPEQPVAYRSQDPETSNGYGTALESGWTAPEPYGDEDTARILAFSSTGAELLAVEEDAGGSLWLRRGAYVAMEWETSEA